MLQGGEIYYIIGWIITLALAIIGWSLGIAQSHTYQRKNLLLKEELLRKEMQLKVGDEAITRLGTIREGLYKLKKLAEELADDQGGKGGPRWVKPDRQLYDIWMQIEAEIANFNFYFEGREIILSSLVGIQRKFRKNQELLTESIRALTEQYFYKYGTDIPLTGFEKEALEQVEKEADSNLKVMDECLADYVLQIQNNLLTHAFDYTVQGEKG